jgi:hypothetical protein
VVQTIHDENQAEAPEDKRCIGLSKRQYCAFLHVTEFSFRPILLLVMLHGINSFCRVVTTRSHPFKPDLSLRVISQEIFSAPTFLTKS